MHKMHQKCTNNYKIHRKKITHENTKQGRANPTSTETPAPLSSACHTPPVQYLRQLLVIQRVLKRPPLLVVLLIRAELLLLLLQLPEAFLCFEDALSRTGIGVVGGALCTRTYFRYRPLNDLEHPRQRGAGT